MTRLEIELTNNTITDAEILTLALIYTSNQVERTVDQVQGPSWAQRNLLCRIHSLIKKLNPQPPPSDEGIDY